MATRASSDTWLRRIPVPTTVSDPRRMAIPGKGVGKPHNRCRRSGGPMLVSDKGEDHTAAGGPADDGIDYVTATERAQNRMTYLTGQSAGSHGFSAKTAAPIFLGSRPQRSAWCFLDSPAACMAAFGFRRKASALS